MPAAGVRSTDSSDELRGRRLLGAVLAGGESRRFGRDKASEPVGRSSMLGRAIAALSPCCTEVVIVSSRSGDGVGAWRVIPDLREASGPLGGIEAALTRAAAEGFDGVFVLACDLPLVDVSIVRAVLDAWVDTPCVAPAREGTPDIEPLCAVYGTECVATVRRLLDAGERRAWMLFEHEDGVRVPIDSTRLMNVNTQADLAVAQAKVTELEPNGGAGS